MKWFYVEQGKQTGPVSEEQFNALLQDGTIIADTLVWREGMPDWVPYSRIQPPSATDTGTVTETKPQAVCSECGKLFPADEMIRYGELLVCANCKPVFLQKLQEGVHLGGLKYAEFGRRFLAYLLDGIILFAFDETVRWGVIFGWRGMTGTLPGQGVMIFLVAFPFVLGLAYEALLVGKYGATLGKMALKMKVVTADGGRVSYARAFGRYFGKMLSSFTCLIGFIIAAFDNPQRRALHDYFCNTRVVDKG